MGAGKAQGYGLVGELNAEWERLRGESRQTVAAWARRHPPLAGCLDLNDLLARTWRDPDAVLGVLLAEAEAGCRLAARVVLQAMLGKLVRMAGRDPAAGIDDYVAAIWCRICTYPLAARPRRIAANLALDTLKAVLQERRWLLRGEVTPWPPDRFLDAVGPDPEDEPTGEGVIAAAGALGLVDGTAQSVLRAVYCEGLPGREAAVRLGMSPGMVRLRCHKAVGRLAAHAALLAEVA